MDSQLFLHAAHQAREAVDWLRAASWCVIGLAAAFLLLTWRRWLPWFRTPDKPGPALLRWGSDNDGWYFEVAHAGEHAWEVETQSGRYPLEWASETRAELRPQVRFHDRPVALLSGDEIRLRL